MLARNLLYIPGQSASKTKLTNKTIMETTAHIAKPPAFVFDKAACVKKFDEVGKSVSAYKGRAGYDVDAWLKENVYPLDVRLNVKGEKTKDLFDAIMALPDRPVPTASGKAPAPLVKETPPVVPAALAKEKKEEAAKK
jgi:hypothetical protein